MEEVGDNEISKFMADIENYKELWEEIEVIVVAVRNGNSWVNLVTKAQLHVFAADIDRTTEMPFRVNDDLVVIRDFFPFINIKQMIEDLKRGTLEIRGYQILYNKVTWNFKVRREEPFNLYNKKWKALQLEGIGSKSIFELIPSEEDLTSKLRSDGKYDSIRDLIGNSTKGYWGNRCYIEIMAPIYIKIGGRVEEDKCLIECSTPNSVNPIDLKLSWRVKKEGEVLYNDKKQFLKSEKVEENKQFCKFMKSIKISNGDSVGYRLFYKKKEIDEGVISIQKEEVITPSHDATEGVCSPEQTSQPVTPPITFGDVRNSVVQISTGKGTTQSATTQTQIKIEQSKEIIKQILEVIRESSEFSNKKKEEYINEGQETLKTEGKSFFTKVKNWASKVKEDVKEYKEIATIIIPLIGKLFKLIAVGSV